MISTSLNNRCSINKYVIIVFHAVSVTHTNWDINDNLFFQDTAYKYIYIGKMQNFYLNSNLGSMSQKSRRKPVAEVIVPQPLTTFYCGEGLGSLTGILGYYNVLFWRCLERSILVTLTRPGLER